ncbi:hypothetical protein R1sor_015971 [Riccia sorocarpa]|uniref:Uncharacterized protein n=1 Tax=Riccia sorocarpa TaxID=122646 RepID=A0ABD3HGG0_9MARC
MASSTSVGASTSADANGSGAGAAGSGAATSPIGSATSPIGSATSPTGSGAAGVGFTGVDAAGSTVPPGVVPPMDATGILQALATLIRQQPVGEMRSTKALQSVVRRLGRFDGREVSHYLREYRGELVLAKVSDIETFANFELVVEPELRDRVREIARCFIVVLGDWELFERAMKEEFLEEDTEHITCRTFLDWVERRLGLTMWLNELFREFDRRYGQLPFRERLTLETRRTELFLRAADDMSADRLCFMLADRAAKGGISSEWTREQEAVSIQTRKRRAMGHYAVQDAQQRYGLPHGAHPLPPATGPIPQTFVIFVWRWLAGLRRGPAFAADGRPRNFGPRQCIWCDSPDHLRVECAPVGGAAAVVVGDQHRIADVLAGHLDYAEVACPVTLEDAYRGRETPRSMEELRRGAQAFSRFTGWEDPVDLTSVQAYLNTGKHVHWSDDATVEDKRRRDATDLDAGVPEGITPRVTRRRAGV